MSGLNRFEVIRRLQFVVLSLCCGMIAASPAASPAPIPQAQVAASGLPTAMSRLTVQQRRQLEAMLTEEVQHLVDKLERIDGQGRDVRVKVTLEVESSAVIADFNRDFLPSGNGGAWEDTTQVIDNLIWHLLGDEVPYRGTEFLIEGKSILEYYPDKLPAVRRKTSPSR